MFIPFNKPFLSGKETHYISRAVDSGKISGNGYFTDKCHQFFHERYLYTRVLLTSSCTDALEMAAILINTQPGDEIIVPSFTFVSTANAFILRGAKIVFADSAKNSPHIDPEGIEPLITNKTKAIVVVHYAGIACDMDRILEIAAKHNLFVIEDAAHAIDSYYKDKPLGSLGNLGTLSFHETKNIISGEGGLLVLNNTELINRAEIVWEKGTNRTAFFRGEIDKYGWVDIGSSFLPSEIIAAFLYAQLENLEMIQEKRKTLWNFYFEMLKSLHEEEKIYIPEIPFYATNNGHMFYFLTKDNETRENLLQHLKRNQINAVFHYLPLHQSQYYRKIHGDRSLPNSTWFADTIIRLPMYFELGYSEILYITDKVKSFFE